MDNPDNYTTRIMLGMLGLILGISIGNLFAQSRQEPEPPQYSVVEYTPECDCYRVVDVIEEMKGAAENG